MKADIDPTSLLNHAVQLHELGYLSKKELLDKIAEFESKLDEFGEFKNLILLHINYLRETFK